VSKAGEGVLRITLTDARLDSRPAGDEAFLRPSSSATAALSTLEFPAAGVFKDGDNFQRKLRWLTTEELLDAMDKGWEVPAGADAATLARGRMLAKTQLMAHLASAVSVFTLAFLAVPLAVRVGRSETFVNAAVGLAVALTYYLLSSMAGYVKDPALRPDLLVWLPNLTVLALGGFLLRRASRH
jgi:lipopolysaccharide export system permease protein